MELAEETGRRPGHGRSRCGAELDLSGGGARRVWSWTAGWTAEAGGGSALPPEPGGAGSSCGRRLERAGQERRWTARPWSSLQGWGADCAGLGAQAGLACPRGLAADAGGPGPRPLFGPGLEIADETSQALPFYGSEEGGACETGPDFPHPADGPAVGRASWLRRPSCCPAVTAAPGGAGGPGWPRPAGLPLVLAAGWLLGALAWPGSRDWPGSYAGRCWARWPGRVLLAYIYGMGRAAAGPAAARCAPSACWPPGSGTAPCGSFLPAGRPAGPVDGPGKAGRLRPGGTAVSGGPADGCREWCWALALFQVQAGASASSVVGGRRARCSLAALPAPGVLGWGVFAAFLLGRVGARQRGRAGTGWSGAWGACLLLRWRQVVILGNLGPALAGRLDNPFFALAKSVGVEGAFQRVESMVSALWTFADLALGGVLLFALRAMAGRAAAAKQTGNRWLPWGAVLLAAAVESDAFPGRGRPGGGVERAVCPGRQSDSGAGGARPAVLVAGEAGGRMSKKKGTSCGRKGGKNCRYSCHGKEKKSEKNEKSS